VTSGIRIGTPAVTTRGMGTAEMAEIANLINTVLVEKKIDEAKAGVKALTQKFPLFQY